jgi:cytochrome c oxidase subunit II
MFAELITRASSVAGSIDALFIALLVVCAIVSAGIYVAMIFFAVKYRRGSRADRSNADTENRAVEYTWALATLAFFLVTLFWAASLYTAIQVPPPPGKALEIYVMGKQWMWKLEHPNGQREINELHVPRGRTIKLLLTSEDVIHSFYVPAFRLKQDAVPGTYTTLWFKPTVPGEYALFCAEYCGTNHSRMRGRVIVIEPAAYERWLQAGDAPASLVARGARLFRQYGCSGCHFENSIVHAPMLDGLYGKPVPLQDGSTVIADERYIHDSIVLPQKHIAAGYPPIMPSFKGQMSEEEILHIIAYIKSLGQDEAI